MIILITVLLFMHITFYEIINIGRVNLQRGIKMKNFLEKHFETNFWLYILSTFCLLIGVVLGMYIVKYMGQMNKNDVTNYFISFSKSIGKKNVDNRQVFIQSLKYNLPVLIGIWFLGLTVIGIPLILILDIAKGFTMGFAVSFLISNAGTKGLWLSLLGVLPQNIIYIPCIIVISVISMKFSISFFETHNQIGSNNLIRIAYFSGIVILIILVMMLGSLIEAFISPYLIKGVF